VNACEIVPHTMRRHVHPAIERSLRDHANIQRSCTESTKLRPPRMLLGDARDSHHGVRQTFAVRR
jgi:hypothetical protein